MIERIREVLRGDREKPGATEGGGADLALLCPPEPLSRWIPRWAPKQKQSSLAPGFSRSRFEPGRLIQSIIRSARGVTAEIFRWCLVTMRPELSKSWEAASAGCELVTKSGPISAGRAATAQTPSMLPCRKNSSRSGLESCPLKRPLQFLLPV